MGFLSLVVLLYCMAMLTYAFRFKAFQQKDLQKKSSSTQFSIIIPFRNEAENLPQLLKSLGRLIYPVSKFEIVLVNDHSDDDSKSICEHWQGENLNLKISILENEDLAKSPKKSAVLTAIKTTNGDYIMTTDADCILPENWLKHFDEHIQNQKSDLIAGSVKMIEKTSFWSKFQVLDMMSLQVIGLGSFKTPSPLFCNAANLCYNAKTLQDIQAFAKHQDILSGDDVFNLEAFQKQGKFITALLHPDATVWTTPEKDFQSLTQQRIRWASKARFYSNKILVALGILVLLTNLSLILSLGLAISSINFQYFLWLWLFKLSVDFYVLYVGNQFFKTQLCSRDYLIMLLLYPFVSVYFAGLSLRGKFNWKDRKYKV